MTHEGRQYIEMTAGELAEAGVPQAAIDAALAARRAGAVKAECKRRIYSVLSREAQMNITAVSTTIAAKSASSRTAEEKDTLAGAQAALGWVDTMRARAAELAADADADFLADASWPACPQEVIDLAARF
jgi:hypothetical protein